jgi:hypothetical protein
LYNDDDDDDDINTTNNDDDENVLGNFGSKGGGEGVCNDIDDTGGGGEAGDGLGFAEVTLLGCKHAIHCLREYISC